MTAGKRGRPRVQWVIAPRDLRNQPSDLRNQPSFDSARTDDELLKACDGCGTPRTRRWLDAIR